MFSFERATLIFVAAATLLPTIAWSQMDEMIVTTRQRSESLQDVPIAVNALSSAQIERQGIANIDDIVKFSPSVQFDRSFGPADTRVTIRGLSNTRGRSNVAFLIDGIDVTTENLNAAGSGLLVNQRLLSDIERVEVIKGPQSALYGRAAFAGAISYITKSPSDDVWEGNLNWNLGDYGEKQFDAAIGGPVTDNLGIRLSSVYWEGDGYYENSVSGEPVGDSEGYALALTSLFRPNDNAEFKLRVEYSDEELGPLPNVRIGGGTSGFNLALFEYPQAALDVGLGRNRNRFTGNASTSTSLFVVGQYCPPELQDPTRGPGFCLPTHFGEADGKRVRHSANPATGRDYEGTTIENFRVSLRSTFDIESIGRITSITGFTDADSTDEYDQDWQAVEADPTLPIYSQVAQQQAKSRVNTRQFSQELRFQTEFEGPIQFTLGSLFWDEKRDFEDQTFIIFCAPGRFDAVTNSVIYLDGFCDGGPTANGNGRTTVDNWRDFWRQLQPQPWINWVADTRHWSFYGLLDWEISEQWTLSFEDRFVSERFVFQKPAFSSCTTFASPNPANASLEVEEIDPATGELFRNYECTANVVLNPDLAISPFFGPALGTPVGWRLQIGEQTSHFNTPRVILTWRPSDDITIYGSWARAQKPGGIATTPGGGSPVSINDDRFEPEKMEAWELAIKSQWDLVGFLQVNLAGFFQDYTDKQVGTQRIVNDVLQPIIINASAAEIWGLELEATWAPSFAEGLTLNLGYTYLDSEYTDFVDNTTSVQRAAVQGGCNVVFIGDLDDPDLTNNPAGVVDPNIALPRCALDLSGNQLERTPEHALIGQVAYTSAFFDQGFDWFAELNAQYQDERFLDADNGIFTNDFWIFDARLGLESDNWTIMLYVDNLFDDDTIQGGGSGPDFAKQVTELGFTAGLGVTNFFGTLPPPRVFGLRASYKFEF